MDGAKGVGTAAVEINRLKYRHRDLARLHNMALQVSVKLFNSRKAAVSDELSLVKE